MATINGSTGNDTLNGTFGADSITADSGNDLVTASGGNDTVYAGAGADVAYGGNENDSLFGGTENDTLYGDAGSDTLFGDAGNDTLYGGLGYDSMFGGDGNDRLFGDNDTYDDFYGGAGDDTIVAGSSTFDWAWGGTGNDSMSMGSGNDSAFGGAGNDTLNGELGNDTLVGEAGADQIFGGGGDDSMFGGVGGDTLDGGTDQDTIFGSFGADSIIGGSGNDSLRGDYIVGVALTDFASGAAGAAATWTVVNTSAVSVDLYWIDGTGTPILYSNVAPGATVAQPTWEGHNWAIYEAGTSNILNIVMTPGTSTTTIDASFNDTVDGGAGADQIYGDLGNDLIYGGSENDSIYGGVGNDTVFGGLGNDYVELGDGNDSFGNLNDEGGNDTIYGGAGNDYIISGGEDDQIFGGTGNDSMSGGVGSDSLYGGTGNDDFYITDDHNFDYIAGGADWDTIYYSNFISTSGVNVNFSGTDAGSYTFGGTATNGTFIEIEQISGTEYADTVTAGSDTNGVAIYGNGGADFIDGGSGNDLLDGGIGNDTIYFLGGDDTVYGGDGDDLIDDVGGISSTTGNNLIYAGAGNDLVWEGGGNDTIYGGDGDDTIAGDSSGDDVFYGGAGADSLIGGLGKDTIAGDDFIATGPNLIVNGSFENTTGMSSMPWGYSAWGGTMTGWTDANGYRIDLHNDGRGGLTATDGANWIDMEGGTGEHMAISQSVAGITSGQVYVLRFDAADLSDANDGTTLDNQLQVTWNGEVIATINPADGSWSSYEFALIGGSGNGTNTLTFAGFGSNDELGVSLDNIQMFATTEAAGGADILVGGDGDDDLMGGAGNDTIDGGNGADMIVAGSGNDSVLGGSGNDELFGGDGDDTIFGGAGGDDLNGAANDDVVYGDEGNDTVLGAAGNDTLFGGEGDDRLTGREGNDSLDGGDGTDTAIYRGDVTEYSFDYDPSGALIVTDLVAGRDDVDTISGLEYVEFNGVTYHLVTGDDGSNLTLQGPNDGTPSLIIAHDGNDWGGGHPTSDVIFGGAGEDTLDGGDGDDTLLGEDGNDILNGDAGNDQAFGGAGDDTISGGLGDDSLLGGNDADTFIVQDGFGNDTIIGGEGGTDADRLDLSALTNGATVVLTGDEAGTVTNFTADTITFSEIEAIEGTAANDYFDTSATTTTSPVIYGGAGDDIFDGGGAAETFFGGDGADILSGQGGDDSLSGDTGADLIAGGDGADSIDGGADDDTLTGGAGNDTLTGGSGADTFVLTQFGDRDTITDFDMTLTAGRTADQFDASALRTAGGDPITWRDVVVTDTVGDGSGDAVLTFPNGESVVLQGVAPTQVDSKQEMASVGIPCFVAGTPILTLDGWRAVEKLREGDIVLTTQGPEAVIWTGARRLESEELARHPEQRPVYFPAGSIGNTTALRLSPQHAVMMQDAGGRNILVRAKHLAEIGFGKARVLNGARGVSYHHLLLGRHSVICAAGALAESFYPGRAALAMLDWPARMAISSAILAGADPSIRTVQPNLTQIYGERVHPLVGRKSLRLTRPANSVADLTRHLAIAAE